MQTLICICNNVHFPGKIDAKESQAFLLMACLKSSQIIAAISAKYSACEQ